MAQEERLRAQVLHSRLVTGRWVAEAANTGSFPARAAEKGTLYLLVELVSDPGAQDTLTRDLVQNIGQEYLRAPGGITHGLRQAVRAANAQLLEYNQQHPRAVPAVAGVSCAVVRGRDLFLGQGGAGLAIYRHGSELRFFPPTAGRERAAPIPLGLSESFRDPELNHAPLNPGDLFVLASPSLLQFASREEVVKALSSAAGEQVLAKLQNLARGQEVSFLVLEVSSEEAVPVARRRGISLAFLEQLRERAFWDGLARRLRRWGAAFWRMAKQTAREMLPQEGRGHLPATRRLPVAEARKVDWRRWAILGGIAALVLLAFLWGLNFWNQRQAQEAEFQELLSRAGELVALSQQDTDPATARALLLQAQELLDEAINSRPGDPQVLTLQEGFRARWDEVNQIQRPALQLALQLDSGGEGPLRLVFAQGFLYLLDGIADQIFAYQWLPESKTLQLPASGAILIPAGERGQILDIAWVEEGGFRPNPALLILTETDLFQYDPQRGISSVQLVDRGNWREPQRIGGFAGNFYVLDANTVWKYFATEAGYTLSPDSWIDPTEAVDLSSAVDMAIDGFIWVLSGDGQMLKFDQGIRRVFELQGLLEPLMQPVALYTDPDAQYLYLADAGLKSILVLDKQGNFVRQFKPGWEEEELFANIQALTVAEGEGVAFVLSSGKLYIVDLSVAPQATPSPTP